MKISVQNLTMSNNILSKEEQQKLNNQIKEKFTDKPVFSLDNIKNNIKNKDDDSFVDNDYFDNDYIDERDYRSIQLDFKTLKDLFNKEQQLYKLEDKSRFQTLDISNLTLKVTELEEKITELEEENTNVKQSVEYIENVIKFHNRDINDFKMRSSSSLFDLQQNITEIELAFRKVEKEYNELLKNMSNVESVDLKRYLNSIVTIKYHSILEVYTQRYKPVNNINLQRNVVNVFSIIIMFVALIYTFINTK